MSDVLTDVGAERALLLACLRDADVIQKVASVEPDDFSSELGVVYAEIQDMAKRGIRVTTMTLRDTLDAVRMPEGQTAREFLAANAVGDIVPDPMAVVARIKDMAQRRELVEVARGLRLDALDASRPVGPALDAARLRLTDVAGQISTTSKPVDFLDHMNILEGRLTSGAPLTDMTGIPPLDERKGGMRPGELCVMAGRPSMGKSAIAQSIAANFAMRGDGVLIMSYEMSGDDVAARVVSDLMARHGDELPYADILRGKIPDEVAETYWRAHTHFRSKLPIRIVQDTRANIAGIWAHVQRAKTIFEERGATLKLIIVDHVGLIPQRARTSRYEHITEASGALASMARETGIATIVLAQLGREVDKRDDHWPQLADLKESGALEQDADSVVLVYRPAYYLERLLKEGNFKNVTEEADARAELDKLKNSLSLIVAKDRNGRTGTIPATIDVRFNRVW
ncbi:MAG: replicative DNA helicase [Hyphomicrobiaceae bacterium]